MFTRKDYMDGRVTHEQYYGQYVTPGLVKLVVDRFGLDRLCACPAGDHFNSIPLSSWDMLTRWIGVKWAPDDGDSLAGRVCILKAAARAAVAGHCAGGAK
jgi:hypothetical protein